MGDITDLFGLLIGFGLVVVIPVVAIVTAHQRKMANLIHKNHESGVSNEVIARLDSMQRQLNELQNRQNELILQKHEQSPPPTPRVEERIQE